MADKQRPSPSRCERDYGVLRWCLALILSIALDLRAADDDRPPVRITTRETWSGVFADSETTFHFQVAADTPWNGRLAWTFSTKGRTIQRGETALNVAADRAAVVPVRLRVPPIKDGVIFPAQIAAAALADGAREPVATSVHPVWMFADDPFADRRKTLEDRPVALFDPVGKTAETFDQAKIPYDALRDFGAIERLKSGVVVVGEGTSWTDFRRLPDSLSAAAARGLGVLCLSPSDGQFPWPGEEPNDPAPSSVTFARPSVIRQFDERFDAVGWPPDGSIATTGFVPRPDRDRVVWEATTPRGAAWPWGDVRYASHGRLVLCGFGIIRRWNDGPTPRFLLARLWEELDSIAERSAQNASPQPKE